MELGYRGQVERYPENKREHKQSAESRPEQSKGQQHSMNSTAVFPPGEATTLVPFRVLLEWRRTTEAGVERYETAQTTEKKVGAGQKASCSELLGRYLVAVKLQCDLSCLQAGMCM